MTRERRKRNAEMFAEWLDINQRQKRSVMLRLVTLAMRPGCKIGCKIALC